MIEYRKARAKGPGAWIVRTVNQARDACLDYRARAHRAWFDGDVHDGVHKPVVTKHLRRRAQGYDFGVRGWVTIRYRAVARARDDAAIVDYDGTDGNFALRGRFACFAKGGLHEFLVTMQLFRHGPGE